VDEVRDSSMGLLMLVLKKLIREVIPSSERYLLQRLSWFEMYKILAILFLILAAINESLSMIVW